MLKTLATVLTFKGLVPRMDSEVVLEIAAFIEFSHAYTADKNRVETVCVLVYYLSFDADNPIYHQCASSTASLVLELHHLKVRTELFVALTSHLLTAKATS